MYLRRLARRPKELVKFATVRRQIKTVSFSAMGKYHRDVLNLISFQNMRTIGFAAIALSCPSELLHETRFKQVSMRRRCTRACNVRAPRTLEQREPYRNRRQVMTSRREESASFSAAGKYKE